MVRRAIKSHTAGWRSLVSRWPHKPKFVGSNPTPATKPKDGNIQNEKDGGFVKIVKQFKCGRTISRPAQPLQSSVLRGLLFYMLVFRHETRLMFPAVSVGRKTILATGKCDKPEVKGKSNLTVDLHRVTPRIKSVCKCLMSEVTAESVRQMMGVMLNDDGTEFQSQNHKF